MKKDCSVSKEILSYLVYYCKSASVEFIVRKKRWREKYYGKLKSVIHLWGHLSLCHDCAYLSFMLIVILSFLSTNPEIEAAPFLGFK